MKLKRAHMRSIAGRRITAAAMILFVMSSCAATGADEAEVITKGKGEAPLPLLRFISRSYAEKVDEETGEPVATQQYWLPDGEVRDDKAERLLIGDLSQGEADMTDHPVREIRELLRRRMLYIWVDFGKAVEQAAGWVELLDGNGKKIDAHWGSSSAICENDGHAWMGFTAMALMRALPDKANLSLSYSSGEWKEVAVALQDQLGEHVYEGGVRLEWGEFTEGDNPPGFFVRLSADKDPRSMGLDYEYRVTSRWREEPNSAIHRNGELAEGNNQWEQSTNFLNLKPNEVVSIKIMVRPWKTVVFRNVSLKAGLRADFRQPREFRGHP